MQMRQEALKLELIHRFGKDRCWTVQYPNMYDIDCKDANEVLVGHGAKVLRRLYLMPPHTP